MNTSLEKKLGNSNFESPLKRRNYQKHSLQFKIKVIKEAKISNSLRKTARDNGIHESLLRQWRKNETNFLKTFDSCTHESPFKAKVSYLPI